MIPARQPNTASSAPSVWRTSTSRTRQQQPDHPQPFPASSSNGLFGPGGGYVSVDLLFIQFAGFTFGKSASAYATPWFGYPGNNSSFLMGGADYVTGVNNIQYTAQFGNGVSATIGLRIRPCTAVPMC